MAQLQPCPDCNKPGRAASWLSSELEPKSKTRTYIQAFLDKAIAKAEQYRPRVIESGLKKEK
jgi:hypothetical protein